MAVNKFGFEEARNKMKQNGITPDTVILRNLTRIGEDVCTHARTITKSHSDGGYDDRTHNLRSSISFRIVKDGEVMYEGGFKSVGGADGVQASKDALERYAIQNNIGQGWVLYIVAGMNYATYVEAKGYNVLHLSEAVLQEKVNQMKQRLNLV